MTKVEFESAQGLGHEALRAQGFSSNGRVDIPVVSTVFPGEHHGQVYPFPLGDVYLTQLGSRVAESGSVTFVMKMLPGHGEHPDEETYLREIGLIPDDASIIQVTPRIEYDKALGYPFTDPAGLLKDQVQIVREEGDLLHYVSTFSSDQIGEMARSLGLEALPRPHSDKTNHKAELRLSAEKYGISMLDGMVLGSVVDVIKLVGRFKLSGHAMWFKFPTGSGGDLVHKVDEITCSTVLEVRKKIRGQVVQAFDYGSFGTTGREFWSESTFAPRGFPLVAEVDARSIGKIIKNGSNSFTTNRDGSIRIHGFFEQITSPQGEYLGSRPLDGDLEMKDQITEQTLRVAEYNMKENGYFGAQGVDYFVIQRPDGKQEVYVVELNTRPIISIFPNIVANRLGYQHWINVNVAQEERPIEHMGDFFDVVGKDLAYGITDQQGRRMQIVPLAFRTLQSRTLAGERLIPSDRYKALILGDSPEHCLEIQDRLKSRGLCPAG